MSAAFPLKLESLESRCHQRMVSAARNIVRRGPNGRPQSVLYASGFSNCGVCKTAYSTNVGDLQPLKLHRPGCSAGSNQVPEGLRRVSCTRTYCGTSRNTSMPRNSAISSESESRPANRSLGWKQPEGRRITEKCHQVIRFLGILFNHPLMTHSGCTEKRMAASD